MANYFTHFSCVLDVGTAENAERALELYRNEPEDPDGFCVSSGFSLSVSSENMSRLWIQDDGSGDPECVVIFVLKCASTFSLSGLWGFEYANTCSRSRLEAFGGGAHVIDLGARRSVGWVTTNDWLAAALEGDTSDA
ncbi:hypothetical protein LV478_00965 (plasmid) [Komagataeibacter oboediens]|uniref:Uncharacterized protein n=1 Tax=Komagataeibacter swingsii TaxID=215220 RepID=A0A2V4QXD9_9PROT|nr:MULTISPECIES: hypothetical protein [Komagataeibacter]AHI27474.1 hypothetical protein H845_3573 [Komagataeibacter xylinus E25]MBV1825867.1 hypothetical protein [Komagataeibacter oboediens]PYD69241.1 hypothetical protein CFR76_10300 [Komagataeibacter swingsii]WEQ50663.1 hypothetical protein LV478_00965 [Komagataeibacter oboediens]GBQ43406.1 hypothetical protein AA18890_1909 [Komagataeibacter europaeus LMG 18890]